ncbi:MAG TPA: glycerophosphodiester phosphodiesterase [Solirubrobacterales bacterium]|nr:glycerophosphodiester phosphodiesterase [Solirubrobacterales bacterium]
MRGRVAVAVAAFAALLVPSSASAQSFWTGHRVLNIAHQGGEAEAPSNTMYAYERALKLGADMLEVDVHTTADGRLVAMHDARVDRTTDGTGYVYEMTLAEVRRLDAAHDFVPGIGTRNDMPRSSYPFRGVRTGERRPPPGYTRADFRIPTLDQVMRAFPEVPINIEIKGRGDTDTDSFFRNADLLAAFLNGLGRTEGIIVASFNQMALERFHAQAPQIAMAPAISEVALFKVASTPLSEGMVAFQVPITFEGIPVTDADFVNRAHARGYAVHVWLSNDGEDEGIYERLLGWNVDGIMAGEPGRLEGVLCAAGVARPDRGKGWPGGRHCSGRSSIACRVEPVGFVIRSPRTVLIQVRRRDEFAGRCAGRIRIGRVGRPPLIRGSFDFGNVPPGEGGPGLLTVRERMGRAAYRKLTGGGRNVVTSQPHDGYPGRFKLY